MEGTLIDLGDGCGRSSAGPCSTVVVDVCGLLGGLVDVGGGSLGRCDGSGGATGD